MTTLYLALLTPLLMLSSDAPAGTVPVAATPAPQTAVPAGGEARAAELEAVAKKLAPLFTRLGKPQPGDWLLSHLEPGQTFRQWLAAKPVNALGERRVLYIQPLGDFTAGQQRVLADTADFMSRYFGLPVKQLPALADTVVPAEARRQHPQWGMKQMLSTYVLDRVLKPRLPKDAAAMIAFTATDLWPGEGWNFVFGQASLQDRVGVWSLYRNGNADKKDEYALCLLRTVKTAVHETGHMFSIWHCTAWECVMCGSNNREESDRRPLEPCPECLPKLCLATGVEPVARYQKLEEFCRAAELKSDAEFYAKCLKALGAESLKSAPQPPTSKALPLKAETKAPVDASKATGKS
jgi:archaemetzincin